MFRSLPVLRRSAAVFLVIVFLFASSGLAGSCLAEPLPLDAHSADAQPITLTDDERLLAHHEGSSAGASQLLQGGVDMEAEVTDSLWGNLLLSMAYRRDPELKKLIRHMGVSNNLFLASIAGISGLGLAQSITGLATLNPSESSGHEHGAQGHDSGHHDSIAPSVMGIVGSGVTLISIGTHVYFEHRYKKKIKVRQQAISHEILHILDALESGGNMELVQPKLTNLVGERASREFLQLWRVVHP